MTTANSIRDDARPNMRSFLFRTNSDIHIPPNRPFLSLRVSNLQGDYRRRPPPWKPPNPPWKPPNPPACILPQPRALSAREDQPPNPPKWSPRPLNAVDFPAQLSWCAQEFSSEK